jgi:hypothetical protein
MESLQSCQVLAAARVHARRYLNNIVEQDHRAIKQRCASMLGLKSFATAAVTLSGIELAHRVRKGQFTIDYERDGEALSLKELWDQAISVTSTSEVLEIGHHPLTRQTSIVGSRSSFADRVPGATSSDTRGRSHLAAAFTSWLRPKVADTGATAIDSRVARMPWRWAVIRMYQSNAPGPDTRPHGGSSPWESILAFGERRCAKFPPSVPKYPSNSLSKRD